MRSNTTASMMAACDRRATAIAEFAFAAALKKLQKTLARAGCHR